MWGVLFLSISIVGFFMDSESIFFSFATSLWVYLAFLSMFCFLRVTNIMFKVLKWV